MTLLEIRRAVNQLEKRLKDVEKFAHEPQSYKKKCDEMEKRIKEIEKRLNIELDVKTDKEIISHWKQEIARRAEMITIGKEEAK